MQTKDTSNPKGASIFNTEIVNKIKWVKTSVLSCLVVHLV